MNLTSKLSVFAVMLLLAACSDETGKETPPITGGEDSGDRREVMLTLKNSLVLQKQTTKSDVATKAPIATTAENTISTLDVYAFGSQTEGGTYTFQERFAYRANGSALPQGAKELDLAISPTETEAKGLLNLKKGLFVKLYCIANQPGLIDSANPNVPVADTYFTPLTLANTTGGGVTVQQEGIPEESTFLSYYTPLLSAGVVTDVLNTPLSMSGSWSLPLDLTDFESSVRTQVGFKLTRLAARFDVINDADLSKFTIESISMGQGRRAAGFFPIRVYGSIPEAQAGELIAYAERDFDGNNANTGLQTGAFYTYPSLLNDGGHIILKGKYAVNQTESMDVTYQIPFKQADKEGAYLEINNNHRYTIAITDADQYHLDFTLTVDDWNDDGSIDEFQPGEGNAIFNVTIPTAFAGESQYDPDTRTATLSLKPNSSMELEVGAGTQMSLRKTYAGGPSAQLYDWLEVSAPTPITKTTQYFGYEIKPKDGYTKNVYPRAVLCFTNPTDGSESTFIVEPVHIPLVNETEQNSNNNKNSFDAETQTASMYRTTNSNLRVKVSCPVETEFKSIPSWLTPKKESENGIIKIFSFTLNSRDVTDDEGTIIFQNKEKPDLTSEIKVLLLNAEIEPSFDTLGGTDNSFTAGTGGTPGNVTMGITTNNSFTVSSVSLDGVKVAIDFPSGSPVWLKHTGDPVTKAGDHKNEVNFSLTEKLSGAQTATVTLKNVSGGKDYSFTVTPEFKTPNTSSPSTVTLHGSSGWQLPYIEIAGTCLGGSSISSNLSWLTIEEKITKGTSTEASAFNYKISLDANKADFPTSLPQGTQTITISNKSESSKNITISLNITEANSWGLIANGDAYQDDPVTYRINTTGGKISVIAYSVFTTPQVVITHDNKYSSNNWLPAGPINPTKTEIEYYRRKHTFEITVPATTGTDAAYQLHKATIFTRQNNTNIENITLWRGASMVPYPTNGGASPYYSAVEVGGYWWAPINCGAKKVATNGTDQDSNGNLYQWGSKVATYFGEATVPGPISDNYTDFVTLPGTSTNGGDWLIPSNNTLWGDGDKKPDQDPCPDGWRIPSRTQLATWGNEGIVSNGVMKIQGTHGLDLRLPVAGWRYWDGLAKSGGNYWSRTPENEGGDIRRSRHVYFTGNKLNHGNSLRVYAFPIRCVQDIK